MDYNNYDKCYSIIIIIIIIINNNNNNNSITSANKFHKTEDKRHLQMQTLYRNTAIHNFLGLGNKTLAI